MTCLFVFLHLYSISIASLIDLAILRSIHLHLFCNYSNDFNQVCSSIVGMRDWNSLRCVNELNSFFILMRQGNSNCLIWSELWSTCVVLCSPAIALFCAKIASLKRNWGWNTEVKGIIKFKLNFGMSSSLRMKLGRGGETVGSGEYVRPYTAFSTA